MDSNTHSTDGLVGLAALVDQLVAQDLTGVTDAVRAERVLVLRRLLDRLEGHWLAELAGVDARGAAGADQGVQAPSTASWLRSRLRMGAAAASSAVRTARALFRGPLTATAQAVTDGDLSAAHAAVLAAGTQDLPLHVTAEAEPVLVDAARRLDPPRLRRLLGHLRLVADPQSERDRAERRHQDRWVRLTPSFEGMVVIDGLLEPEAGQTLLAALEPLARPHSAQDDRSGGQRTADALAELARRQLEGGRLPQTGGVRPQLAVLVDLDSLQGRPGAVGGDTQAGALDPEACRRLGCDGAVTRVLVTRHPTHHHQHHDHHGHGDHGGHHDPGSGQAWPPGCGPPRPCCRRPWVGPQPSRWRSVGPPGSSSPPNAPPWPSATAAVCSPTATGPFPGAKPIICGTGWMAARPTWTTWPCCAAPIIGRSTRRAGGWPAGLMVS